MKTTSFLTAVLLLGSVGGAAATSFAPPKDRVLESPNGRYALHIDAESGRHEVKEGEKLLWSFQRDVWHHDYFVSDDGNSVLWVSWLFVQAGGVEGPAMVLYSKGGEIMKKTFLDLSDPRPYRADEVGPVGDFWRIWRGEITREGEVVAIAVEGREKDFEIDLSETVESQRAGRPAPGSEPGSEGDDKRKPESEGRFL